MYEQIEYFKSIRNQFSSEQVKIMIDDFVALKEKERIEIQQRKH